MRIADTDSQFSCWLSPQHNAYPSSNTAIPRKFHVYPSPFACSSRISRENCTCNCSSRGNEADEFPGKTLQESRIEMPVGLQQPRYRLLQFWVCPPPPISLPLPLVRASS